MDEKVNLNVEYFKKVFCPLLPKRGNVAADDAAKVPIVPGLPPSWQLTPEEAKKVAEMKRPEEEEKKGIFFNPAPAEGTKGIFDGYPEYDEND